MLIKKSSHFLFTMFDLILNINILTTIYLFFCIKDVNSFIPMKSLAFFADSGSVTHQEINEESILRITLHYFQDNPQRNKPSIYVPGRLSPERLFAHYYGKEISSKLFKMAIDTVSKSNAKVDLSSKTRNLPSAHFDAESFSSAQKRLQLLRRSILSAIDHFHQQEALEMIGEYLHTLQDFYSHTNWVELDISTINKQLGLFGVTVERIAPITMVTCRDCHSRTCRANILPDLNQQSQLTSGYMSGQTDMNGKQIKKPEGKCSHGGLMDKSSRLSATGGINKDSLSPAWSSHHYLHHQAVRLALDATYDFLSFLRNARGDSVFDNLFNLRRGATLAVVIDTTGSMGTEIEAVKKRIKTLVENLDTRKQEHDFVLVPFNDPKYGPVTFTHDASKYLSAVNSLQPIGGGDNPELSFSGIRLALQHVQSNSMIFVFTDAPAKDAHLADYVTALANRKQVKINFIFTDSNEKVASPKLNSQGMVVRDVPLRQPVLYSQISHNTGGELITTRKDDVEKVSKLMNTIYQPEYVTVLYRESPARPSGERIAFTVDPTISELLIQITGDAKLNLYRIETPTGDRLDPKNSLLVERLIDLSNTLLYRIRAPSSGVWMYFCSSLSAFTSKVTAVSSIDFTYRFALPVNSTHPGWYNIDGNPPAGEPIFILIKLGATKMDTKTNDLQIKFVRPDGSIIETDKLTPEVEERLYSYRGTLPSRSFRLVLCGKLMEENEFRRFSPVTIKPTNINLDLSIRESSLLKTPGSEHIFDVKLTNKGPAATFIITIAIFRGVITTEDGTIRVFLRNKEVFLRSFSWTIPSATPYGAMGSISTSVKDSNENLLQNRLLPFIVDSQEIITDSTVPNCSVGWLNVSKSSRPDVCYGLSHTQKCSLVSWTASFSASDLGTGLHSIHTRPTIDWRLGPPKFLIGTRQTVQVKLHGSCCIDKLTVFVSDVAGNSNKCTIILDPQLNSGHTYIIVIVCCLLLIFVFIISITMFIAWRNRKIQTLGKDWFYSNPTVFVKTKNKESKANQYSKPKTPTASVKSRKAKVSKRKRTLPKGRIYYDDDRLEPSAPSPETPLPEGRVYYDDEQLEGASPIYRMGDELPALTKGPEQNFTCSTTSRYQQPDVKINSDQETYPKTKDFKKMYPQLPN